MLTQDELRHPFSSIDVAQLDGELPSLLAYAEEQNSEREDAPDRGLSVREKRLFRFGVLVGQGEWELGSGALGTLADDGLLSGPEVERAAAEAGMIKGWPACVHLGPALGARGLRGPSSVAEAVQSARAAPATLAAMKAKGAEGLTEREIFALGLGITWGARCWDT